MSGRAPLLPAARPTPTAATATTTATPTTATLFFGLVTFFFILGLFGSFPEIR